MVGSSSICGIIPAQKGFVVSCNSSGGQPVPFACDNPRCASRKGSDEGKGKGA
jgi:hypothetical protein